MQLIVIYDLPVECNYFQKVVNDAYKVLMPKSTDVPPEQNFCNLLNISACQFTEVNKEASIFSSILTPNFIPDVGF